MRHTLPKREILRSKVKIQELFDKSSSYVSLKPLRVIYRSSAPHDKMPQVLFSVSKKRFRRAVDRNYIKRRLREAYRLHKHLFYTEHFRPELIAIVYTSSQKPTYLTIQSKMIEVFHQIRQETQP